MEEAALEQAALEHTLAGLQPQQRLTSSRKDPDYGS